MDRLISRAYDAERRRLTQQRALAATILAIVLVPLFAVVDFFMYRQQFLPLLSVRAASCVISVLILFLLRSRLGRHAPGGLTIALTLETGMAIAAVPVYLTGTDTPHYVSMALLILSIAAMFPWTIARLAALSAALCGAFGLGAVLHGPILQPTAFGTEISAILVTSLIGVVIAYLSERMRLREFAARQALHGASREKTRLIHDLEQKTGELEAVNQELELVNQEMEDVLYVASHDLRAPLINVQGFANELSVSIDALRPYASRAPEAATALADIDESLQFIQSATGRMDGLINGLLSVSRIATRTRPTENVQLQQAVEKIVESFQYQLDQQHIDVVVGTLPDVKGDPVRLNQVFSNLVDNAIKYMGNSAQRRIEIGARNGSGPLAFYVRDSGPGIPVESQDTVFRLFRRLGKTIPGEGLGLTLVRKIIEKHGGRIWIESAPGQGATFWFTIQERPRHRRRPDAAERADAADAMLRAS